MAAAIDIKNLKKSYMDVVALKNLNLKIKKGEFFGYLGPNGAGKTTTISIMMGIAGADSGSVKIFGNDVVEDYQKARRLVGLSPQEFNFDPYFSIRRMLRYQAGYYGIGKKEAYKRADELLEKFELKAKANVTFRKLSGGMKRRLAIAKAMIHDPEILVLDEPTSGLDVELRHELWEYMKQINKEGKTILLTTHYIEEAQRLCNRIGILNKGDLIALDDKNKLMKQLSNKVLRVEPSKKLTKLPIEIKKLDANSILKDGEIIIHLKQSTDLDKIIKTVQKNIKIKDIQTDQENLEEIFVRMINNE